MALETSVTGWDRSRGATCPLGPGLGPLLSDSGPFVTDCSRPLQNRPHRATHSRSLNCGADEFRRLNEHWHSWASGCAAGLAQQWKMTRGSPVFAPFTLPTHGHRTPERWR